MYQLFGYSGSGNVFFLRKHLSEDQTDEWSAVEDLPEESNWEVHECCLTPGGDYIASCLFEQDCCNKTHARAHDTYDHGRDCKSDEDWSVLWCNDTEGKHMCKFVNESKFQNEGNRPHDFQFAESHQEYFVAHSSHIQANIVADHDVNHQKSANSASSDHRFR